MRLMRPRLYLLFIINQVRLSEFTDLFYKGDIFCFFHSVSWAKDLLTSELLLSQKVLLAVLQAAVWVGTGRPLAPNDITNQGMQPPYFGLISVHTLE